MKNFYMLLIFGCLFISGFNIFASGIVFDPTNYAQALIQGSTMAKNLTQATETAKQTAKTASTVDDQLNLDKINSQGLSASNWESVSNTINATKNAANVAGSMTYATSSAVDTFDNLFPGKQSDMRTYADVAAARTNGTLNTFKGNLSAIKSLGDSTTQFENEINSLRSAQGLVKGHESAAEQGNQIAGNMLNTQQIALNAQLSNNSNASAYYAYQVQARQDELNADKTFIGSNNGSTNYDDNGQGAIPTGGWN